ncbi:MAG TPA: sulfurtransferase TusA family protein [Thermoplasmata archaeon]|nr:sulfurtransferase TusA family protein [Thermoplasmata archaeon]
MELSGCPFPDDARYDAENDVWVRAVERSSQVRLGITSALSSFVGRVLSLRPRTSSGGVTAGVSLATIETVRFTGPLRTPVPARSWRANPEAVRRPRLLNDAPYGEGWAIELDGVERTDLERLPRGEAARAALLARVAELRVRCEGPVPDVEVIELGSECSAVLARLDTELTLRAPGDIVRLVSDDPTSPIEMVRWADRTGHAVLGHYSDGPIHRFVVRREARPEPKVRSAATGRVGDATTASR